MSVIPGGQNPRPSGALSGNLNWLRDVDEDFIKQHYAQQWQGIAGSTSDSFVARVRDLLIGPLIKVFGGERPEGWGAVTDALNSGVFGRIASAFTGGYSGDNQWLTMIRDGQAQHQNRVDLLSPLLDYCSTYAALRDRGHARFGAGLMPFSEQIGPSRNVEVTPQGRLRLMDRGLWDIRATVVASWTLAINPSEIYVSMYVRDPQGQIYSETTLIEKQVGYTSFSIVSSVVIPDPGYTVEIMVDQIHRDRGVLGGPKWSRLTVQHITRSLSGNTGAEDSTAPIDEPDNPTP